MADIWTKSRIHSLLKRSNAAVLRALIVVYQNQTPQEQHDGSTVDNNGLGFTGVDAEILTSFVNFYHRAGFLTERQLAITRNKITKYWAQLLAVAEMNGHQVSYNRKA